jgi:septum formation protein
MSKPRLVLASASPARRRMLLAAGIDPEVIISGIDESAADATTPETLCLTLARLKAQAVADLLRRRRPTARNTFVLGCDSMLAFDGQVLGKPADADEAVARWQVMRGHTGTLHTGHCVIQMDTGKVAEAVASTLVRFAEVTDAEIEAYIATGEPLKVAGAFTIDGIGGPFVESVDGDPGTVVGLSLPLLRHLLVELDTTITAFWRNQLTSGI